VAQGSVAVPRGQFAGVAAGAITLVHARQYFDVEGSNGSSVFRRSVEPTTHPRRSGSDGSSRPRAILREKCGAILLETIVSVKCSHAFQNPLPLADFVRLAYTLERLLERLPTKPRERRQRGGVAHD